MTTRVDARRVGRTTTPLASTAVCAHSQLFALLDEVQLRTRKVPAAKIRKIVAEAVAAARQPA